ncbi:MAG: hypothetical protein MZV64_09935 [Ignavibacteriales bacterium]|nr:hypothetical protein [Ignavibacteriales bacterium]
MPDPHGPGLLAPGRAGRGARRRNGAAPGPTRPPCRSAGPSTARMRPASPFPKGTTGPSWRSGT